MLTLTGRDWQGHFFRGFDHLAATRSMTDEQLELHSVADLPHDTISNLHWIIPLMLDEDPVRGRYHVVVHQPRWLRGC